MKLDKRRMTTLTAAAIAAATIIGSAGCGTTGAVLPMGSYGTSSGGSTVRPRAHQGVDFLIMRGAKVIAPAEGTIMKAVHTVDAKTRRSRWRCGHEIEISHTGRAAGITTRYCHLGKVLVNFGDTVTEGQVIATVGQCGIGPPQCSDHLHFETVDNYIRKNPLTMIKGCYGKGSETTSDERPLWHPLKC